MYINEELLHSDYENPDSHLKAMLQSALTVMTEANKVSRLDFYKSLDTLKCINDYCDFNNIEGIDISNTPIEQSSQILGALNRYYTANVFNNPSNSFTHHFSQSKYEFTEGEYQNIQDTITKLRNDIQQSSIFGDDHQSRLLKKLEELQKELHMKMNRLDKVLGQITSIGITLGKFGKDAKPMFDRFNETFKIVHKAEERGDDVTPIDNQLGYDGVVKTELLEETTIDSIA